MTKIKFRILLLFATVTFSLVFCRKGEKGDTKLAGTMPPPAPTNKFSILNKALVTQNSIYEANALYQFLLQNYGKKIVSGVMTLDSFDETNWLKANTGKEPAIIGLDFMHCYQGYTWYDNERPIKDAKIYWEKKGIPAITWHWRDPSNLTENFYTAGTSFDVSRINNPDSDEYKAMIRDIDAVSGLLKKLQEQQVPVIWRPLHEAAGGWFWWGAKGAQPCKKLYQLMYDRMVNHHGLRNLIWVWTHEPNDNAWYPGDEYVDIVGRDNYKQGDHSSQLAQFNAMHTLYSSKKMVTLSECGSMPDVDNLVKDGAAWSWFMPWYGEFTRKVDGKYEHNSLDLWKKMMASDYVITLDEMPSLKRP
ncbi:glycosyl hydrolase [Pedobacter sp. SYSU D00535]|uniref:glycosyl hydrolase n=1 Tax=Pedobacter sp. SYSU D00535 TaxID=2810308 RepID=UPI001A97874E|nr:glycosyl hydrolase [Pedobacter sp. SYSU D00535]